MIPMTMIHMRDKKNKHEVCLTFTTEEEYINLVINQCYQ